MYVFFLMYGSFGTNCQVLCYEHGLGDKFKYWLLLLFGGFWGRWICGMCVHYEWMDQKGPKKGELEFNHIRESHVQEKEFTPNHLDFIFFNFFSSLRFFLLHKMTSLTYMLLFSIVPKGGRGSKDTNSLISTDHQLGLSVVTCYFHFEVVFFFFFLSFSLFWACFFSCIMCYL
jgi:hypothetical protein